MFARVTPYQLKSGTRDAAIATMEDMKADIMALQNIPFLQEQMGHARRQARDYGDALQRKYPDLRLKRFAVVALGFERLWCESVSREGL